MTTRSPSSSAALRSAPPSLSEDEVVELERVFKALADRHRVQILNRLLAAGGEAVCVCDFEELLGLKQSTVSYHLKQLLDAGIVEREKRGSFAYFSLRRARWSASAGCSRRPPRRWQPDQQAAPSSRIDASASAPLPSNSIRQRCQIGTRTPREAMAQEREKPREGAVAQSPRAGFVVSGAVKTLRSCRRTSWAVIASRRCCCRRACVSGWTTITWRGWCSMSSARSIWPSSMRAYRADGHGRAAHDPAMMVALLLYSYAMGQRSSRAIERRCHEDVPTRVICANQAPDHTTIARFRVAPSGRAGADVHAGPGALRAGGIGVGRRRRAGRHRDGGQRVARGDPRLSGDPRGGRSDARRSRAGRRGRGRRARRRARRRVARRTG